MKRCKKCGVVKPRDEFYRASGMRDGLRSDCKACNLAAQHRRYVANPAPAKARVLKWQQENADRLNAYRRERRSDPTVKQAERASHLRRKYGLSPADYRRMLVSQGGVCAICRQPPPSETSLHVDHDHETNEIRGLLCFRCNNALGDFDDSVARLDSAASYLRAQAPPWAAFKRRLEELRAMRPVWERV